MEVMTSVLSHSSLYSSQLQVFMATPMVRSPYLHLSLFTLTRLSDILSIFLILSFICVYYHSFRSLLSFFYLFFFVVVVVMNLSLFSFFLSLEIKLFASRFSCEHSGGEISLIRASEMAGGYRQSFRRVSDSSAPIFSPRDV